MSIAVYPSPTGTGIFHQRMKKEADHMANTNKVVLIPALSREGGCIDYAILRLEHVLRIRCSAQITSGMPSGTVTEGECSDSTGTEGAPAAKAGDDDDSGESDGEPARPHPPHHSKPNRRRTAKNTAPSLPQSLAAHTAQHAQPTVNLTAPPPPPAALWKLPQVLHHFPVSRATWYAGIKDGRYPSPVKLGARAVAWKSSDILALTV